MMAKKDELAISATRDTNFPTASLKTSRDGLWLKPSCLLFVFRVNCPFYFKIGACRHGDGCSRTHLRPHFSQTLMIPHLYIPPAPGADGAPAENEKEHFEEFYEEV